MERIEKNNGVIVLLCCPTYTGWVHGNSCSIIRGGHYLNFFGQRFEMSSAVQPENFWSGQRREKERDTLLLLVWYRLPSYLSRRRPPPFSLPSAAKRARARARHRHRDGERNRAVQGKRASPYDGAVIIVSIATHTHTLYHLSFLPTCTLATGASDLFLSPFIFVYCRVYDLVD